MADEREIREELQAILTAADDAIQVTDAHGVIKYVNPAFTRVTGIPPRDRLGKRIFDVSPDGALAQVLKTGRPVRHWPNRVKGTNVQVISNAAPVYVDGEMRGAVVVFHDVTEWLRLADELEQRSRVIDSLQEQLTDLARPEYGLGDMVGNSRAFRRIIHLIMVAAQSTSNVLILGESGTGKGLVAQAIHRESTRSEKPFLKINCAAIPENLLESEFFGYEKGAFTGALKAKPGKFEVAHGGTVFLDEIGDMPAVLQGKLLQVLQEKEFTRIGGTGNVRVDVRVLAATNRPLEAMVSGGTFRTDLYYRLNVLRIDVPPLRERTEDIPLLVGHIIERLNRKLGRAVLEIAPQAYRVLQEYAWPGNVREMENVLERVLNLISGPRLTARHLQGHLSVGKNSPDGEVVPLAELEKEAILGALRRFGTDVAGKRRAAAALGLSLSTLYKKLGTYKGNAGGERTGG